MSNSSQTKNNKDHENLDVNRLSSYYSKHHVDRQRKGEWQTRSKKNCQVFGAHEWSKRDLICFYDNAHDWTEMRMSTRCIKVGVGLSPQGIFNLMF